MAINNQPTIEPRTVTGIFTKYIAKTLPLAFDESMSYYECLCALLEYLNEEIVPDINNVNNGLSELQTFYLQLQEYVNTYFDNLDVQEEVNNKLDDMAEDGTLSLIIQSYINPIIAEQNQRINEIDVKVNNATNGSPLVASSTSGMTDTSRIYVNTSDGYWYYYNGTAWTQGGIYQATSDSGIVENLNNLLGNINIRSSDWEIGGFSNSGAYSANESAIRYKCEIPSFIEKAVLRDSSYKLYVVKKLKVSPNTTTREEVVSPFTFDHSTYFYNVYIIQNPSSQSASVNDYNKLFLYTNLNNIHNLLLNKYNIEELPKYKYIETSESDFEDGFIDGTGAETGSQHAFRYIGYLPSTVTKIKIFDKNGSGRVGICRYLKSNDSFVDRFLHDKEYDEFNHDIYKYKIYVLQTMCAKSSMWWNVILYENNEQEKTDKNYELNYFYDEDSSTYYSLLRINKTKYNGSRQYPFVYAPHGATGVTESTLSMMTRENYEIGINAGIAAQSLGTFIPWGIIIENGVVIKDTIDDHYHSMPLTIDSNGDLSYSAYDADADDLVNNGIVSAVCGWFPIVDNFAKITDIDYASIISHANQHAQRQIIGQFANGDYAIITGEGRGFNNSTGWTIAEAQNVCTKHNLKFAYNLDGGGSTETVIDKKQINLIYEQATGRGVQNYIVFNGTSSFN